MLRRILTATTAGCLILSLADLVWYELYGSMPLGRPMFLFLLIIGGVAWLSREHSVIQQAGHRGNLETLRKIARR